MINIIDIFIDKFIIKFLYPNIIFKFIELLFHNIIFIKLLIRIKIIVNFIEKFQ